MNDLDFTYFTEDQLDGDEDQGFTFFTEDQLEPDYHEQEELLPLYSREIPGKGTQFTSFPEQFEEGTESQFQPIGETPSQEQKIQEMPQEVQPSFEGENDIDKEIERNIAQQTSRQIESVLGMPGDIGSILESATGIPLISGLLGQFLPTSSELKDLSEKATSGYTKPLNEFEESMGEFTQDITSFLMPGSKQYSMLRNIGIPVTANLAKEGMKLAGEDKIGEASKVGLMIVLDLMSQRQGGAKKHINSLFTEMEKRAKPGIKVEAKELQNDLGKLKKSFEKGGERPSTTKALSKIDEILGKKIQGNQIDLDELMALRPAINEAIDELKGFEYIFKPKLKKMIISNLQEVKGEVIKGIENYASRHDPELLKLSRSANEAYAAYAHSNKIKEFLDKNFSSKVLSKPVQILLGIGAPSAIALGGKAATAAALPLATAYQTVKMFSRLKNSETLRKYYSSFLKAASSGNVGQASRSIKAMEKELEDEEL